MKNLIRKLTCLVFIVAAVTAASAVTEPNDSPEKVNFVVSDIDNFWRAYDLAQNEPDRQKRIEIYQKEYLDKASDGLKSFTTMRIGSAANLVARIESMPKYYASIRPSSIKAAEMVPQIRESMRRLKTLYPDSVFPNVYFMIGRLNSGGTVSDAGLLIGTEMYCLTPDAPRSELNDWLRSALEPIEDLDGIVGHELAHCQQKFASQNTLLEKALKEGGADFVGELISGKNINRDVAPYGRRHEKQLWAEFAAAMNGTKLDRWLYNGGGIKDRPADLGYFVGYRICQSYYRRHAENTQAIADILNITDAIKFLKESGYATRFD